MIRVSVFTSQPEQVRQQIEARLPAEDAEKRYDWRYYSDDVDLMRKFAERRPHVLLTIGADTTELKLLFPRLYTTSLPYMLRQRWLHYAKVNDLPNGMQPLANCSHAASMRRLELIEDGVPPLVSMFSNAFKSKSRIQRCMQSLQQQTNPNWEWVVMNDSPADDSQQTWQLLRHLAASDCRIRCFDAEHTGMIGENKFRASMMCRGAITVELDHDDELMPEFCQRISDAFADHPDIDFVHTNWCEPAEEPQGYYIEYGQNWGSGYGHYYRQFLGGEWVTVGQSAPINPVSIRGLVCAPNHARCWRTTFLRRIGSYNSQLRVTDDHELLMRTFCEGGRMAVLPEMLYRQYRNYGGSNFTTLLNAEIQRLVSENRRYYDDKIHQRCLQLGIDDTGATGVPDHQWGHHSDRFMLSDALAVPRCDRIVGIDPRTITILMPTFRRTAMLHRAIRSVLRQTYPHWVLMIVGDKCGQLEHFMRDNYSGENSDPRLRYWDLYQNGGPGGHLPRNYGAWMCSTEWVALLDDDNEWLPNHLQSLVDTATDNPRAAFVFSSYTAHREGHESRTVLCTEPRLGRIDTSCLLHRHELFCKYGMWKDRSPPEKGGGGYCHDWEIVSRWLQGGEEWAATLQPTLLYNCNTNGQTPESMANM
jgi:glycosyltransferase involved in cell wall biosynthesis